MRTRVLFVCSANAARSQMAESLLLETAGDRFDAFSAGVRPAQRLHPLTTWALERAGVVATGYRPTPIERFRGEQFDTVITFSDDARDAVAVATLSARQFVHWNIDDPLAAPVNELRFLEALKQIRRRVELFAAVSARQ